MFLHLHNIESQRYMTPTVLGTLNGLFSLIKFGLMECFSGFGPWIEFNDRCWLETEFTSDYSAGRLSFEPQNSHTRTEEIVDELATLLTAGRLNDESRKMIKDHFESAANDGYGLRLAQQLIVSTPEFHSTNNILKFSGEKRPPSQPPQTSSKPYKAVVYLLLNGGKLCAVFCETSLDHVFKSLYISQIFSYSPFLIITNTRHGFLQLDRPSFLLFRNKF